MTEKPPFQLVSYIAPGAPATRRPARGDEPFLRPETGFTPKWHRENAGIDFGEAFHRDPVRRRAAVLAMRGGLERRFPGTGLGRTGEPLDLLTGAYGACAVAAMFGVPVHYLPDQWPTCAGPYLDDDAVDRIEPVDPSSNPFFQELLAQVEWIAGSEGRVEGFINWQGVLNNAHRLRGEALFMDMMTEPERCRRLFNAVAETMIAAARLLHERQRASGVDVRFFTLSNCLVNLVSPELYRDLLLPFDRRVAESFACVGVHNCAWTADPYLEAYAEIPRTAYMDMGLHSDLARARALFPDARRAIMYTPTDLANKTPGKLRADLERIAGEYGPCDLVAADIESGTPDGRVLLLLELCRDISAARA